MKVIFKNGILALSGKNPKDGLIYCYNRKRNECIARKPGRFTPTEATERLTRVSKNILIIYKQLPEGYKLNFKCYVRLNPKFSNPFALFIKIMWMLYDRFPEIDLETITIDELRDSNYPIHSVAEMIESGLLNRIRCTNLNQTI
ncbi:MAG TPA: hypothetical protein PLE74_11740 [Candidatus Cloacimonadota bacterium]|nr:hypothetical protein [Candidatus Cloacimonadota bacterium]